MIGIDLSKLPTKELADHDSMMVEAAVRIQKISALAIQLWSAVLKELSNRKQVSLISGSFDDIGNAHITRNYEQP
jgi:hypothetical protein